MYSAGNQEELAEDTGEAVPSKGESVWSGWVIGYLPFCLAADVGDTWLKFVKFFCACAMFLNGHDAMIASHSTTAFVEQTFIKVVNYQHMMPTRYTLDMDLKNLSSSEVMESHSRRLEARKVKPSLMAPVPH